MTDDAKALLAKHIRTTLACGKELAEDYASAIADPPEIVNGAIIVRNEDGRILARIPESVLAS